MKIVKENIPVQNKEELNNLINKGSKITGEEQKKEKPFNKMNNIIAHLLSNITCSMRFKAL